MEKPAGIIRRQQVCDFSLVNSVFFYIKQDSIDINEKKKKSNNMQDSKREINVSQFPFTFHRRF